MNDEIKTVQGIDPALLRMDDAPLLTYPRLSVPLQTYESFCARTEYYPPSTEDAGSHATLDDGYHELAKFFQGADKKPVGNMHVALVKSIRAFAQVVYAVVPLCPERTLALRALELARMSGNKLILLFKIMDTCEQRSKIALNGPTREAIDVEGAAAGVQFHQLHARFQNQLLDAKDYASMALALSSAGVL